MTLAAPAAAVRRSSVYLSAAGTIDIDRVLANQADVSVGDSIVVLGRRLLVVRIHRGGNSIFQTTCHGPLAAAVERCSPWRD